MQSNNLVTKTLKAVFLILFSMNTHAALINIDFSGVGGTLTDGTTYTLSGDYTGFGSGVRLADESVTITFSSAVNLLLRSNLSDTHVWNNPADGVVLFTVNGGGTLGLVSDLDAEIAVIVDDGTSSVGVAFSYNATNLGPNGNDLIASNQNWSFAGATGSTFTLAQLNSLSPNTSSFEVLAEGGAVISVPVPETLWLLSLFSLVFLMYKKAN